MHNSFAYLINNRLHNCIDSRIVLSLLLMFGNINYHNVTSLFTWTRFAMWEITVLATSEILVRCGFAFLACISGAKLDVLKFENRWGIEAPLSTGTTAQVPWLSPSSLNFINAISRSYSLAYAEHEDKHDNISINIRYVSLSLKMICLFGPDDDIWYEKHVLSTKAAYAANSFWEYLTVWSFHPWSKGLIEIFVVASCWSLVQSTLMTP